LIIGSAAHTLNAQIPTIIRVLLFVNLFLHKPDPPLAPFVELFTYFEGYDAPHQIERLLPEGVVEIVIDLTETPKFIFDNQSFDRVQTCRTSWVSGVRMSPISISAGGRQSSMFIIRFRSGMAYPFLRIPVGELRGSVVEARALLGPGIRELREQLLEGRSPAERFEKAENFLLGRLRGSAEVPAVLRFAVDTIAKNPQNGTLRHVVHASGYSHKHLISLFGKHTGITPLSYLRLLRFQQALRLIHSRKKIDWPGIALDCGYYDQSHFINDFRAFSAFTPGEYLQRKGNDPNYIPVL
jgi:AraC-like DNA-binding protein